MRAASRTLERDADAREKERKIERGRERYEIKKTDGER